MSNFHFRPRVCLPSKERMNFAAKVVSLIIGISALVVASGCSGPSGKKNADLFAGVGSPKYPGSGPLPKGGGRRHVGKTYTINGVTFHPKDVASYEKVGVASWYGPKFHRRQTSNGEWFDMHDLTAAHTTLPLPSYVKVINLDNGKEAVLRVNDRGPFAHDRIIDLSKRSAEILGFKGKGTQKVRVVLLGKAPLEHDGTHLHAMNRKHLRHGDYTRVAGAMNYDTNSPIRYADTKMPDDVSSPTLIAGDRSYYVQAASFLSSSNADQAKRQLSSLGPVIINPVSVGYSTYYRVSIGPLDDNRSAEEIAELVRSQGMRDARIIAN